MVLTTISSFPVSVSAFRFPFQLSVSSVSTRPMVEAGVPTAEASVPTEATVPTSAPTAEASVPTAEPTVPTSEASVPLRLDGVPLNGSDFMLIAGYSSNGLMSLNQR